MKTAYHPYHPEPHRERLPIFWWLRKLSYAKFITRELTSLAVAYAAVLLLVEVAAVARGPAAYARFLALLATPPALALHGAVLLFLLFHTLTWLGLAPQAMVLRLGGRRVPDRVVLAAHYLAWLAASGLVAWWVLGGRS
ncbi:MAG: fumarate reductase subunit C [Thermoanaerobaculia bacterium]